jgi:uncharacterized protein YjbJ (UPF0337 family)
MDKDSIEGKIKDIEGRIKRQVGEWTGNKDAQAEGTKEQVEGKVQNAFGKVKDSVRDALNKGPKNEADDVDRDIDRDKKDEDVA